MRKTAFCICENKAADQLGGYREADQRLCFRYTDSTVNPSNSLNSNVVYPRGLSSHTHGRTIQ